MNRSTQLFVSCIFVIFGIFAIGCGGEGPATNEAPAPSADLPPGATCVPGEPRDFVCADGKMVVSVVCSEDGMSYNAANCPPLTEQDSGTTPEASPEEDAGTEPDAEADAEVEAGEDSGIDAGTDANADPILTIQGDEPQAELVAAGTVGQIFHSATFCTSQNIDVQELDYKLLAQMGGKVVANDGTPYFTNIKLIDLDVGNTLMGPMELDSNGLTGGQNVHFIDEFTMQAGECKHLAFIATVAEQEVNPGDLYGHYYQVYLNFPMEPYGLVTLADGTELKHNDISLTNHVGGEMTIVAPDCPPYHAQSSLSISEDTLGHPEPTIVIGGKDAWAPMARYQACVQGDEDVKVSKIGVQWRTQNGAMSAESFSLIGVASEGYVLGTAQFDNNDPYGIVDVELGNGVTIAKGDCQPIELWAKFTPIVSSMQAGGEWSHQPRSGKDIALRIGESVPQYGYDAYCNVADYAGKLFVHARGLTTNEKIFADEGVTQPSYMVIRKNKPVVTPLPLSNTTLSAGERELARWQVGADSAGGIAMKQFPFYTEWTAGVSLSNFRLYRGSVQVPLTDYTVVNMSTGADLKTSSVSSALGAHPTVAFVGEDIVNGAGNLYSLRATTNFTSLGHHVTTKFMNVGMGNITGVLMSGIGLMPPEVGSPYLWHVQEAGGGGYGVGHFIASDVSEAPHSASSPDWFTGYLVDLLDYTWNQSN